MLFLVIFAVSLYLIRLGYYQQWTGFNYYPGSGPYPETIKPERAKTLWDWLDLLVVPFVLGLITAFISWRQHQTEIKRYEHDQEIAQEKAFATALQNYLDKMTELMMDKEFNLLKSKEGDAIRNVARAQTLETLRMIDEKRRGSLVRFLHGAKLITGAAPVISLAEADLEGVTLDGADLSGINLDRAHMRGAHLTGTILIGASLKNTHLHLANLNHAILNKADLTGAILKEAHLNHTKLIGAIYKEKQIAEAGSKNLIIRSSEESKVPPAE